MISAIIFLITICGCGEKDQDTAAEDTSVSETVDTSSEGGEESEGEDTSSEGGDTAAE